jgi:hypothetical protein
MTDVTRRGFLTRASVVSAGAAVAVTGLASLPSGAEAAEDTKHPEADLALNGPAPHDVVVHIVDAKTSEVALIAGTEELVFHDPRLVRSVLRRFKQSTKE